jgi:hypothetical protein
MTLRALLVLSLAMPGRSSNQNEFFETRVRPVLAKNCFACHVESHMGGLTMGSRESLLKGGNSGAAIVPGNPDESLLIQAVRQTHPRIKMPPKGKLNGEEIADFEYWVKAGAVWPEAAASAPATKRYLIRPEQRQFWSFRAITKPAQPLVKNRAWVKAPIDAFILSKLEASHLKPAAPSELHLNLVFLRCSSAAPAGSERVSLNC